MISKEKVIGWRRELLEDWRSSQENFQEKLIVKFEELLQANSSSREIYFWVNGVPYTYWNQLKIEINEYNRMSKRDHYLSLRSLNEDLTVLFIERIIMRPGSALLDKRRVQAALHLAASDGCVDYARQMIEKYGADVSALDSWGWNSLCFALDSGRLEMAMLLIRYGASCDFSQAKMFCPFFGAAEKNNSQLFQLVLGMKTGLDIHCAKASLLYRSTCLQAAAAHGRRDIMLNLLKGGADPNVISGENQELIHYVVKFVQHYAVETAEAKDFTKWFIDLMKDYKIEFHFLPSFENKIMCLLLRLQDEKILETLIKEHGLDFSKFTPGNKILILNDIIAYRTDHNVFKLVLTEVQYPAYQTSALYGKFLFTAVRVGNIPALKYLLDKGANCNKRNDDGLFPLDISVQKKCLRRISLLLLYGAHIHDKISLLTTVISAAEGEDRKKKEHDEENRKEIIHLFLKYIAISEFSEARINDNNSWYVNFSNDVKNVYRSCQNELLLMKNSSIHDSITFLSVLRNAKRFSRDPHVIEALAREDTREKFPIYFDILSERFNIFRKKYDLLAKATNGMEKILKYPFNSIPIIFDNIFAYLSCRDLRNLSLV